MDRVPGQLSFDAFDAPEAPLSSLFFALRPDAAAAAGIAEYGTTFAGRHGFKGSLQAEERLHATMLYIDEYRGIPPYVVERAIAAATSISLPQFEIAFDRLSSFPGKGAKRPLVLLTGESGPEIRTLQEKLHAAVVMAGLKPRMKPGYTPHVTLGYGKAVMETELADPFGWVVKEFVLLESLVGQSEHVLRGRWPLVEA